MNNNKIDFKIKEIKSEKEIDLFKANNFFKLINNFNKELSSKIMIDTEFDQIILNAKDKVEEAIQKDGLKYMVTGDLLKIFLVYDDQNKDKVFSCLDIRAYAKELSKNNDLNEVFILGALCDKEIYEIIQLSEALSS